MECKNDCMLALDSWVPTQECFLQSTYSISLSIRWTQKNYISIEENLRSYLRRNTIRVTGLNILESFQIRTQRIILIAGKKPMRHFGFIEWEIQNILSCSSCVPLPDTNELYYLNNL